MPVTTPPFLPDPFPALLDLLRGRCVVALVGAGCSTESGIPDYRGPQSPMRNRKPMQYQEFVGSAAGRARYWARSAIGWRRVADARPNAAHEALARLEAGTVVHGLITQNVDGLHQAAGSRRIVELHGSLAYVRCLACGGAVGRAEFQQRLVTLNRAWSDETAGFHARDAAAAPDGDAELPLAAYAHFRVPSCDACGGVLKPDVVFFGENVPKARVDAAWALLAAADVLLVVGSSLTVFSGRRFVYGAQKAGIPIAIVNLGPTRADECAALKIEAPVGTVLPRLADALLPYERAARRAATSASPARA